MSQSRLICSVNQGIASFTTEFGLKRLMILQFFAQVGFTHFFQQIRYLKGRHDAVPADYLL